MRYDQIIRLLTESPRSRQRILPVIPNERGRGSVRPRVDGTDHFLFSGASDMTALNGYVHDRFRTSWMLMNEALATIACVILGLLVLRRILNRSRARGIS